MARRYSPQEKTLRASSLSTTFDSVRNHDAARPSALVPTFSRASPLFRKPPRLPASTPLRFRSSRMPAPQPSHPRASFRESPAAFFLGTVLLLAALLAAYSNTFNVPFLLDDADSIELNPTIKSLATAWLPPSDSGITTSGRPLLNLSLAINYALHGTSLPGYHLANLLIHALGALTLWAIIRRTLRQPVLAPRFAAHATPLAWCAAALWALHPLQTESVTYIVQRAESLVGLFYFLTLYGFIRSVEKNATTPRSRLWPALTIFACLCGMASKEVMASAPLIVFLYDRTFVSGTFTAAWQNYRRLHLSLAATWLILLACIIQSGGRGTTVGYSNVAWWEYAITQAPAITGYLWRSLWPANLIFDYGAILEKNPAVVIPSTLFILILLGLAIHVLRRHPVAGFAFAWFFLILAPTSSIIPVASQTAAEHRMYLPLAACVVPAALLLYRFLPLAAFPLLAALLLAAGFRTHDRNHDYRSELALWEDTVARLPDNVRALTNLGSTLFRADRFEESLHYSQEAIRYLPTHADAHLNLGGALLKLRRLPEAIASLERAAALNPDSTLYLTSLGNAASEIGDLEKALRAYRRAYELAPGTAVNAFNLANTLMSLDRMEESGRYFTQALSLSPNDSGLLNNYATWLRRSDRPAEAIPILEKALHTFPQSPRLNSNLGTCLMLAGRTAEGIQKLELALQLDPNLPQTRFSLGSAYAETGRPVDAITQFEALLTLSPPNPAFLDHLGVLYAQTARYTDAATTFRRALALEPTHPGARENLARIEAFLREQSSR
jgi:tetratricopeptide (TPR) repeat protein